MNAHHATQTAYAATAADYFAARATISDAAKGSGLSGDPLDQLYTELEEKHEVWEKLETYREARHELINQGLDLVVSAAAATKRPGLKQLAELSERRNRLSEPWLEKLCKILIQMDWRAMETAAA